MLSPMLSDIEEMIGRLSRKEPLWLTEQCAHRLGDGSMKRRAPEQTRFKSQRIAMADDFEVQAAW